MCPKKILEPNFLDRWHQSAIWLIGLILLLVPLWVIRYIFVGLIFYKAMLFYILITALIAIYLWLVARRPQFLPRLNLIGWSFLGLIIILIISTIFSAQPYLSFWGNFQRFEGLLTWLYYFAFFILSASLLRKNQDWLTIIGIASLGAGLVSIYAIGQALHLPGIIAGTDPSRAVESTLGNPIFLGGYLAIVIPLTLAWVLQLKHLAQRWGGWCILGLEITALALTFSRGAWLAGLIGLGIFLVGYACQKYLVGRRSAVVAMLIVMAVIIAGLSFMWASYERAGALLGREESINYRRFDALIGRQAIQERPVIGWGLENFSLAFDKYYRMPPPTNGFYEAHADRAHNAYIDMAVFGGLPALIIYIILLIAGLWGCIKQLTQSKDRSHRLLALGGMAALAAYAIFVGSAFHLIVNVLLVWLILAWANQSSDASFSRQRDYWFRCPSMRGTRAGIMLIGILLVGLSYWSVVRPILAVRVADRGTIEFKSGNYQLALAEFQRALVYHSFMSNTIRQQMMVLGSQLSSADQPPPDFSAYTAQIIEQNNLIEPYNSYHRLISGMYLGGLAKTNPQFLPLAEDNFARAAILAPGKAETYVRWGEMYAKLNRYPEAEAKFNQALQLEPDNGYINSLVGSQP